jgi:hypothetical protein
MKRDMDIVREMLLKLEAWPMRMGDVVMMQPEHLAEVLPDHDLATINQHMNLIRQAGFIDTGGSGPAFGFAFKGLSWDGCEFLDSVRDPKIWRETKAAALKAGGVGLTLMAKLAIEMGKQEIKKHTGFDL